LSPRRSYQGKVDRSLHSGRIATVLREAVVTGALPSGTPLTEARLADELGVSRGPVRSALQALDQEGLAVSLPNGRMVVLEFGREHLDDLFRVRFEIESLAIAWGIERGASVDGIASALEQMTAEGSSTEQLVELDIAFHREIIEFSGSRALARSWNTFAALLRTVITVGNRRLRERDAQSDFKRIMEAHAPLVHAIRKRDRDLAVSLLREQFAITRAMLQAPDDDSTSALS
jgi:DNA-binding GntR family transcriptional regulator